MEWDDGWTEREENEEWTGITFESTFALLPILDAIQRDDVEALQRLCMTLSDEQVIQLQQYMSSIQPDLGYQRFSLPQLIKEEKERDEDKE